MPILCRFAMLSREKRIGGYAALPEKLYSLNKTPWLQGNPDAAFTLQVL